jgi:hypothetical protein
MPKYSYVGKYRDGGSQNSFYKVRGKPYGFKSFPNKSLATFAHAVQSHLAPFMAPKVYSQICRIRVPNYFATYDGNGGIKTVTHMVLSNWGYLTEIATPFVCRTNDCEGCCWDSGFCPNYDVISSLLDEMNESGIDYIDAHANNLGYVKRGKHKVLVAIDFGRESLTPLDEEDWPEVCWDGAEDMECCCESCCNKYEELEYA